MLLGIVAALGLASVVHGSTPPGLYVTNGVLMRAGKPYRGVGVNYFDCFARTLKDPANRSFDAGFADLARLGIPFARFMCGGFWPVDMELYRTDRADYFRRLDRVVRSAEKRGIGLIPSLFWNPCTIPDLVGEPVGSWGDPLSKTHAFMRTYVREVVTRYRRSRAIWGWEFGNEYNLGADLPNAREHRPPVWPNLGTATSRSEKDELSHTAMRTAIREFAREVRKHDPSRIIVSGNSIPRLSAWHQMTELSWTRDTPEQFQEMLIGDSPDPVDTLSIHIYEPEDIARLSSCMQAARKSGKPLFVGEFGGHGARSPEALERMIQALETSGAPLSALWVFDFAGQDDTWNVTRTNSRSYQLDAVAEFQRRLRSSRP